MKTTVTRTGCMFAAALLLGTARAQELITPTTATAQSYYSNGADVRSPARAIDGSGMTPNAPVTTASVAGTNAVSKMWLSNNTRATWITFDLGEVRTLSGFHLWNYNETGVSTRGIQTAGIYAGATLPAGGTAYASCGAAWGTLVTNMTLAKASGLTTYAGEDYTFATPVTTRYLQFWVTTNWGGDAYTGISEIRFYKGQTPDIAWFNLDTTNITTTTAWASASVSTNLDNVVLVCDASDKGTGSTNDWTYRVSLGAWSAGRVTGQMTGLAGVDTVYVWRLYGANATTNAWSYAKPFATSLTAAQAPMFTLATPNLAFAIDLSWQDNALNETGYVLQRSTNAVSDYATIATLEPNATSYRDRGLTPETAYYYQLAATNALNGSGTAFTLCSTNATTTKSYIKVLNSGARRLSTVPLSFDAGAEATKLVISIQSESYNNSFTPTYNGVALTMIPNSNNNRQDGIWYLDNPYTGGPAELTVNAPGGNFGFGVVSLSGALPGYAAVAEGSTSATLTPQVGGSFVMAGFAANTASGLSAPPDLTQLYLGDVASTTGYSGHENSVAAAAKIYTFSGTFAAPEFVVAAFSPHPIYWSGAGTTCIPPSTAVAAATVHTNLDSLILVWDATDKGPGSVPGDWAHQMSLGAQSAGVVSGPFSMEGLAADSTYVWRLYGTLGAVSGWSMAGSFSTALSSAQTPVFTNAAANVAYAIDLRWQDNAALETGYIVQRSLTEGSGYETVATLGSDVTFYRDRNLTPDTAYYYQLAATNAFNGSATEFALCRISAKTEKEYIKVVNTGSKVVAGDLAAPATLTLSFDAGATANKLIVAVADEEGYTADYTVTYNGVALTFVSDTKGSRSRGIWYLDNPYTGGAAPLIVSQPNANNGLGFGAVSISGALPGYAASARVYNNPSISITPAEPGSFVMVNFACNTPLSGFVRDAKLTQIYSADVRSSWGFTGYQNSVQAETQTYTFTYNGDVVPDSCAIVFSPIPPPPKGTLILFQ